MVNTEVNTRLTRMLSLLEDKATAADIARELKVSRVAVSKAINRLKKQGLVSESPESQPNLKFYRVNQILIHHDKQQRSPNYHGHASEHSYIINERGNLPEGDVNLRNWSYWSAKFGDFSVKVHYGKQNKLIIYPPDIYRDTKADLLITLGEKLTMIVNLIERMFKCSIDIESHKIIRRLEVHAPNDPLGRVFEREKLDIKGSNIEINQSGHAHFDINGLDSFEKYDRMIGEFDDLKQVVMELKGTRPILTAIANTQNMMAAALRLLAQEKQSRELSRGHVLTHRRGD